MNVTMGSQRLNPVFVANSQAGFSSDSADTSQPQLGKLLFPFIQQRHGVTAGDGEKKFEVLAVGQRRQQGRFGGRFTFRLAGHSADRDGSGKQFASEWARTQQM